MQNNLLTIINWLEQWKRWTDENGDDQKFFSKSTWNGLQRMILGYVGMIEYYVIGRGFQIHPINTTTDPCEHHFCNVRQSMGANKAGTADLVDACDARANIIGITKTSLLQKCNNAMAPKKQW